MKTHDTDENARIAKLAREETDVGSFSFEEIMATLNDEDRRVLNAAKDMFEELDAKYNGAVDIETVWDEVWERMEKLENQHQKV